MSERACKLWGMSTTATAREVEDFTRVTALPRTLPPAILDGGRMTASDVRQFRKHIGLVTKVIEDKWPAVYRHLPPGDRSSVQAIKWNRDAPRQKRDVSSPPEQPTDGGAGVYRDPARDKWWHDDDWQERALEELDGSPAYDRARDFYREGERGLWKAIQTFDRSRRVKFSTWAYRRIEWAILDHVRRESKVRDAAREPTVYAPEEELPPTGVEDLLSEFPWRPHVVPVWDPYEQELSAVDTGIDIEDELIRALSELDPVHAAIVCGRLGIARDEWGNWLWSEQPRTQADIARELGLTRKRYQLREKAAMRLFRAELARRFRVLGLIPEAA